MQSWKPGQILPPTSQCSSSYLGGEGQFVHCMETVMLIAEPVSLGPGQAA